MRKLSLIMLIIFLGVSLASCAKAEKLSDVKIQIEAPLQNAEVGLQEIVKGKVSNPKAKVYALVHPLLTNMWWIQRMPSPPNQDGSWQALCYFGTETKGIGESFEVVAIVTNKNLEEGKNLTELPKESVRTDIITVRRTH